MQKTTCPSFSKAAWFSFGFSVLFYAYQFTLRVSPGVMSSELMQAFSIDTAAFGLLASCYYYAYAPFQVPMGILLDRWGVRNVLILSVGACAVGTALFLTQNLIGAYIGRFMVGFGSAASFLICIKIASMHYTKKMLPALTSMAVLIGTIGAVGGGAPLSRMTDSLGWVGAITVLTVIAFIMLVVSFFVSSKNSEHSESQKTSILNDIFYVLKLKRTWLVGCYGILMYVPLSAFCDLWGVSFLKETYVLDESSAAFAVSLVYVGLGFFAPLSPVLLSCLKSYKNCFIASSSFSAILFSLVLFPVVSSYLGLCLIMVLLGGALTPQILAFAFLSDQSPKRIGGLVNGFHNMVCMLSGIIMQPFIGSLLKSISGNTPVTQQHYQTALSTILFALLASVLVAVLLPKPQNDLSS